MGGLADNTLFLLMIQQKQFILLRLHKSTLEDFLSNNFKTFNVLSTVKLLFKTILILFLIKYKLLG